MKVLLIDTETTGLDPKTDRVIEIGTMITDENFGTPLDTLSLLMWDPSYPPITEEITKITGITATELMASGLSPNAALNDLATFIDTHQPVAIVAFNSAFDQPMIKEEVLREYPKSETLNAFIHRDWLCAMVDNAPNYQKKCWKLSHLTLDYGVAVDPATLHRALGDIELTRQMLRASGATASSLASFRGTPWVYLKANTTAPWKDNGASNKLAMAQGYSWQKAKGDYSGKEFTKTWVKRVKLNAVEQELNHGKFRAELIKE